MSRTTRVLLFDDDALLGRYLRQLFNQTDQACLVGEVAALPDLITSCLALEPDVLLIGGMVKPFVLELPALFHEVAPTLKIIALLPAFDPTYTAALLATKLDSCLLRHEIAHQLLPMLHSVTMGGTGFSRTLVEQLAAYAAAPPPTSESNAPVYGVASPLTEREQEVLHLLAQGLSNKAIAHALGLTQNTVEQYLRRIYQKLKVNSRVEAVTWFMRFSR